MGLIWFGGEEIEMSMYMNLYTDTTASYRRSANARSVLYFGDGGWAYKSFQARQSLWFSARRYRPSGSVGSGGSLVRTLAFTVGLVDRIGFKESQSSSPSAIQLVKYDGAAESAVLAQSQGLLALTGNMVDKWDVCIENFDTDNCRVRLFVNNLTFIDYTGKLRNDGDAGLDGFIIRDALSAGYGYIRWSELMLADEDTRPLQMCYLAMNAAGDVSGFSGGTYTQINEVAVDPSTVLYTNTPNTDFLANVNDTPAPVGGYNIRAVKTAMRHVKGPGAAVNNIQHLIKSGGTIHAGPSAAVDTIANLSERLMEVNPVTGNPWTAAEITALQTGMRAVA